MGIRWGWLWGWLLLLMVGCGGETAVSPATSSVSITSTSALDTAVGCQAVAVQQPCDPRPFFADYLAQQQQNQFAWDLFLYLNWAAVVGERGKPDKQVGLAAGKTAVWQTWKSAPEVYVAAGKRPLAWDSPILPTLLETNVQIDGRELKDKQDRPTLLQVNLNQATFNYIVNERTLYSRAGQIAFFNDAEAPPIQFPAAALEVKAVWRLLAPSETDRYFTSQGCYLDDAGQQQCGLLGLTALHVISKVQPNWFWATFEQQDNQQTTEAPLTVPVAADVAALNQQMQAQLAGTPWVHYRLRGTQTAFMVDSAPTTLANTQIETWFQESSSCMTCHALASVGENGRRADMWDVAHGNIVGYVGNPPPIFNEGKFKALDYVWSLRRAQ